MMYCDFVVFLQLLDSCECFLSLMNDNGETRDDIRLPEGELGKDIQSRLENNVDTMVTILKACGEEMVVGTKNITTSKK